MSGDSVGDECDRDPCFYFVAGLFAKKPPIMPRDG